MNGMLLSDEHFNFFCFLLLFPAGIKKGPEKSIEQKLCKITTFPPI